MSKAAKPLEFDKGVIGHALGRRVTGIAIKRRKPEVKGAVSNLLYLMFEDGTGMEIPCAGELIPCHRQEAFDLHRVTRRGDNAYENEYLAITDPDGTGQTVLINTPLQI